MDLVDPAPLESVVRRFAPTFGITGVKRVTVCDSLAEAVGSRYFFEALLSISRNGIPFGKRTYAPWRKKMAKRMSLGKELYFCGVPK